MKNVEWLTSPLQTKDYYLKKIKELDQWYKWSHKTKTPTPIDERNLKDATKELYKLANSVDKPIDGA